MTLFIFRMEEFLGLRIYRDGKVERKWKKKGWTIVENVSNSHGYNTINVDGKAWKRHRLVVAAFNPEFEINNLEHVIDHIDGNKLNNAFDNLRVVTQQANTFNTNNKGYYWHKDRCKWHTRIKINYKQKHLGYFETEEEARAAYLAAKEELHVIQELC